MTDVHTETMHSHPHEHAHEHPSGLWAILAGALHLPGHTHEHGREDAVMGDDRLAIRTVWLALLALGLTTIFQIVIVVASGSVALLADTVHNLGDALNSIPLLIAFYLARRPSNRRYTYGYHRAEDIAGVLIVVSIAFSAAYILWESTGKLLNPRPLDNPGWVVAAALIGFVGNESVALLQIRTGRKIGSEALVADGLHARTDGFTSLAVLVAAVGAWLGYPLVDPIIGILIGLVIVFIARDAAVAIWYRLMDAVDPQLVEAAERVITEHAEVKHIHKLQLRWLGHRLYAETVVAVEPHLTIAESDILADHITHHLYHAIPLAEATVAIVPQKQGTQAFGQEWLHHRV